IVCLQDVAPIAVVEHEEARVSGMIAVAPLVRESSITERRTIPSPTIGLKHPARRSRRKNREVVCGLRIGKTYAVEAAPGIGPSERPDQALADAIALERRKRGILGNQLGA